MTWTCEEISPGHVLFLYWSFQDKCLPLICSVSAMRTIAAFLTGHHKSGWHVRELITVQIGLLWALCVRISSKSSSEQETRPKDPRFSTVFVPLVKPYPSDDFGIL